MTIEALAPLLQKIAAAHAAGRLDEVEAICQQVLKRHGEEANTLMFLALARMQKQSAAEGIGLLERARAANPAHAHVLANLGAAYRQSGRLPEARAALEAAIAVDPRLAVTHHNLGNVLADLGDRAAATRQYRKAVELQPSYADPLAALAGIAESEHELTAAMTFAEQALRAAPRHVPGRLVRARVLMRTGATADAARELRSLVADQGLVGASRVVAHGYLGDCYDRLGEYDEAYAQFSAANRAQLAQYAPAYARYDGIMSPAQVGRLRVMVQHADPGRWPRAEDHTAAPVFIVGFPRSGTTLLDQILASHPDVSTLEERPALIDACERLLVPGMGHDAWERIEPAEVAELRARYWSRVAQFLPEDGRRRLLVDKYPLNSILLPVIHWLFPEARIVLVLRDPRDVLLSCYQQRFEMNGAMYQLLRLDTAADYYDRVMDLVRACRETLPLELHVVRYEQVIGNFDETIRGLLDFLGMPWSDAVRNYADTARAREVRTPSAAQVVQPLYGSSQGRWRNYRRQLEPVLPVLDPWVSALGYGELTS